MHTKTSRQNDLDQCAQSGYIKEPNPHLFSSSYYYAHALGSYLEATGRTEPQDVKMSRGYSIKANGMLFKIIDGRSGTTTFERVQ